MTRKYRRPLVALLLALAVVATATVGSAATLTVNAASISNFTVTHPCPGTLAATTPTTTGTATTVQVTPPAACAGRRIDVAVNDGAVVRQGTATAPASGIVTVTLDGAYTPSEFGVIISATADGWHLGTAWSYTAPLPAPSLVVVNATDQTGMNLGSWTPSGESDFCLPVTITQTLKGKRTWAVDLNVASVPFSGAVPTFTGAAGDNVVTAPSPDRPGWLRLTGTSPYDSVHHNGPTEVAFTICTT